MNWPASLIVINENCHGPVLMDALRTYAERFQLTDEQATAIVESHPELDEAAKLWVLSLAWPGQETSPPRKATKASASLRVAADAATEFERALTAKDREWLTAIKISL
jgi:hypothetical protein